jgi:hypothetical protein
MTIWKQLSYKGGAFHLVLGMSPNTMLILRLTPTYNEHFMLS